MSANITPAKRESDPENDPIQSGKHPKLTAGEEDEKPPIETSKQLIIVDDHPPVPGSNVDQPKIAGVPKFGYVDKPFRRGGLCVICKKITTHTMFSCPDKVKVSIVYDGVLQVNYCDQCSC